VKDFDINIILNVLSLVALLGGGFLIIRSKTTKENIAQQKELIETLGRINETYKQEIVDLRTLHVENTKAIANLEGQIKTLKEVPLGRIMNGITIIEQTNKSIAETQGKIVDLITSDRSDAKTNRRSKK